MNATVNRKKVMNIFDFIVYNEWKPFFMVYEVKQ